MPSLPHRRDEPEDGRVPSTHGTPVGDPLCTRAVRLSLMVTVVLSAPAAVTMGSRRSVFRVQHPGQTWPSDCSAVYSLGHAASSGTLRAGSRPTTTLFTIWLIPHPRRSLLPSLVVHRSTAPLHYLAVRSTRLARFLVCNAATGRLGLSSKKPPRRSTRPPVHPHPRGRAEQSAGACRAK